MLPPTTGYYSLIQYCPDRGRMEAANIGVLLFCPERQYLRVRLSSSNERIRHFFGEEAGDLKQINAMKKMLEHRLEVEKTEIGSLAALQRFAALMANELVITEPRSTLVEEPDVELAQLYDDLVARTQRREPPPEVTLENRLRMHMETPRLRAVIQRNVRVTVPVLGHELTVPFAYQNGRRNLIEAHEFHQRREQDFRHDLCNKAAQGRLIHQHSDPQAGKQQLVIVASLGAFARDNRSQIEAVLRDHDVEFYEEAEFHRLENKILTTAH